MTIPAQVRQTDASVRNNNSSCRDAGWSKEQSHEDRKGIHVRSGL